MPPDNVNESFQKAFRKYKDRLPLLSIGQMIEFLDDNKKGWWGLNADELCDKLWEAVKEVLNE